MIRVITMKEKGLLGLDKVGHLTPFIDPSSLVPKPSTFPAPPGNEDKVKGLTMKRALLHLNESLHEWKDPTIELLVNEGLEHVLIPPEPTVHPLPQGEKGGGARRFLLGIRVSKVLLLQRGSKVQIVGKVEPSAL